MKGLKYALLSLGLFLMAISSAKADAYCIYDSATLSSSITCKANSSSVICLGSKNAVVLKYSLKTADFMHNNIFVCPANIYTPVSTLPNQVTDIIANKKDGYNVYTKSPFSVDDTNKTEDKPNEDKPNSTGTTNITGSATCTYEGSKTAVNPINVTCNVSSSGVKCSSSSNRITGSSLIVDDFVTNNKISCKNSKIYIKIDNSVITDISKSSKSGYDSLDYNSNKSTSGRGEGFGEGSHGAGFGGSFGEEGSDEQEKSPLDLENFCQGPVQGVFTTLGWVFFIIKIVIPILLIIFGSIDVAKAIISSKDDELKKSIKTLVIRVIAGIIIFFIPTLLNFAVKLIDDSDVYRGTFWDCTKCMLNPNGNVCSDLRGNK